MPRTKNLAKAIRSFEGFDNFASGEKVEFLEEDEGSIMKERPSNISLRAFFERYCTNAANSEERESAGPPHAGGSEWRTVEVPRTLTADEIGSLWGDRGKNKRRCTLDELIEKEEKKEWKRIGMAPATAATNLQIVCHGNVAAKTALYARQTAREGSEWNMANEFGPADLDK